MVVVVMMIAGECCGAGDDYNKSSIYTMMIFDYLIFMAGILILLIMVKITMW